MEIQTLKTRNHSAFKLYYHVIFTVKYRKKCITAPMLKRLEDIFADTLLKWRCRLLEFGGESDPKPSLKNEPSPLEVIC